MIEYIHLWGLFGFVVFAILDIKYKQIPAFWTTGFLFSMLVIYGMGGLLSGAVAFVLALLLAQSPYQLTGEADIKLLVAFGIMLPFKWILLTFLLAFMFYGIIYKAVLIRFLGAKTEIPFVPVITMTYLTYLLVYYL